MLSFFKGCCTNIEVYCSDSYVILYSRHEIAEILLTFILYSRHETAEILLTLTSNTNQSIIQSINHITQDCQCNIIYCEEQQSSITVEQPFKIQYQIFQSFSQIFCNSDPCFRANIFVSRTSLRHTKLLPRKYCMQYRSK